MHKNLLVVSIVVLAVGPSCDCGGNAVKENHGAFSLGSDRLEFGPVTEFTQKTLTLKVRNIGNAPLDVTATIDPAGSAEFSLTNGAFEVPAQGEVELAIVFSPMGPGEDTGAVLFTSDDPDQPTARATLHGGPIFPALSFDPDGGFLSFSPTSMALTTKHALVVSSGGATLHVTAIGVNAGGNPDFSVVPPALPATLKPGEQLSVQVDYAKSMRTTEGLLEVVSDDADAGLRTLRLLPDPAHACSDGADNEPMPDGLIDFPDDPGCTGPDDEDEYNPPQCVNGAMQPCGNAVGICRPGTQVCMNSIWGRCDGGVSPTAEVCNGLDDNCMGGADESITDLCTVNGCAGVRACIPNSGVDGGSYGACMPIAMSAEICDGIDNDCNGQIDNGIVETCTINGCLGTRLCIPGGDGGFTACAAANPATETCNGIDDDCDGTIDDVFPALQTCGSGVCARSAPACVDGGIPACVPGMGTTELCNGIDDDCDGTPDDGLGNNSCGVGACFRMVPACLADGGMNACVPGPQTTETCNGMDDDCDNLTDENLTRTCYTGAAGTAGVGLCRSGTQTCTSGSYGTTCPGEIVPAATEACGNANDENCNGQVDEGCDAGNCNPNGLYTRDGGSFSYTCCGGLVNINIGQFLVQNNGALITPGASQPGSTLTGGPATTCPSGPLSGRRQLGSNPGPFSCVEVYFLDAGFVGPNEIRGVYTVTFSGSACTSALCGGDSCFNQSWPVQAFR